MSDDLTIITEAFDAVDIKYTIRRKGDYFYLFIGERRDIHSLGKTFKQDPLDLVLLRHKFLEFETDESGSKALVSYSNS